MKERRLAPCPGLYRHLHLGWGYFSLEGWEILKHSEQAKPEPGENVCTLF
jgi:hypothetical protein